jgi:hypothetical protein
VGGGGDRKQKQRDGQQKDVLCLWVGVSRVGTDDGLQETTTTTTTTTKRTCWIKATIWSICFLAS